MQIAKLVKEMDIQYKRFSAQDIQLSALIEDKNKEQAQASDFECMKVQK